MKLNPIIMREYYGEPLTMTQKENLAYLYDKHGELEVQRVMFHGVRALRKKEYEAYPRELEDSYYEESDTVVISTPPEPRPATKYLNRHSGTTERETPEQGLLQVSARHHAEGIVVYGNSYSPSRSPPKAEKSSIKEKPHWPTRGELVAKAKAFEAVEEESVLLKRPPEPEAGLQVEEELAPLKEAQRYCHKRGFIPRRQPFKLWIEEHKKRIAAGQVPNRDEYMWEAIEDARVGEPEEIVEYGKAIGADWDKLYGPNFDPVFAERELRAPGAKREGWQRMKDKREPLWTKQCRWREWRRQIALKNAQKANAEAQAECRRHETLDEEAKRLEDKRKREKERYHKKIEAQGGEVRAKRTPSEQREARLKAKRDAEKARRDKKKAGRVVQEEQNEEEVEPC